MVEGAGDDSGSPTGVKPGEAPAPAGPRKATVGDLLAELKRRRVFRVMVGYAIFAFAALQVAEPLMHGLHLPDWVLTAVIAALVVGFPVALVLAWLFDLTAKGVTRTPSARASGGIYFSRRRLAALLVIVGLIGLLPGFAWYFWKQSGQPGQGTTAAGATPSIAVLPFADMSPRKDQEYIADGVAEEILNALAQVEGLRVSGRTSSFSFKGRAEDLPAIGQKLGVGTVLEGSVRKAGNRIRITAQLVKTADGFHLWSQTFDRDISDIFAVQDEIAQAVVGALRVRLLPGRRAARSGTANPDAYEQLLLGRDLTRTGSQAEVERAVTAFEKALAIDPGYAQAWVGLADALASLDGKFETVGSPELRRRWGEAADRAVELGPDLAGGWVARGYRKAWLLHDWTGGLADLQRAREISPGASRVLFYHGRILFALGRIPEAVSAMDAATAADPLSASAFTYLGQALLSAGDPARAEAAVARALELAPMDDSSRYYLNAILIARGRAAEALLVAEKARQRWVRLTGVALAEHELGHGTESKAALDELIAALSKIAPYQVAQIHAWRGDADGAFVWLERAHEESDAGLTWIKTDPFLKSIRADSRWKPFLREMNLPVE